MLNLPKCQIRQMVSSERIYCRREFKSHQQPLFKPLTGFADRGTQVMIGATGRQLADVVQKTVIGQPVLQVDRQRGLHLDVVAMVIGILSQHVPSNIVTAYHGRARMMSVP